MNAHKTIMQPCTQNFQCGVTSEVEPMFIITILTQHPCVDMWKRF